jgi:hypothetical protein
LHAEEYDSAIVRIEKLLLAETSTGIGIGETEFEYASGAGEDTVFLRVKLQLPVAKWFEGHKPHHHIICWMAV